MNNPVSTYRIQFHKDFTFFDFEKIVPYLEKLGVTTIYASPVFEASKGSVHGYDGINPLRINPEIGTREQLEQLSRMLHQKGMQWLQDIVPNHMAFDPHNPWLNDVLEKGRQSEFASFFDVPWTGKIFHGKIMLPFLGSSLEEVIENNELKVAIGEQGFVLKYGESAYPLHLHSYPVIFQAGSGEPVQSVQQLLEQVKEIRSVEEPTAYTEMFHELKLQLAALMKNEQTKHYLESCLANINESHELIVKIANEQVYRLCDWKKTDSRINFRRFFTVNGLIGLKMEDKKVFLYYHKFIKELIELGIFQGLRIDHIDGLFDPERYLNELRQLTGRETYIVVEKILEPGEALPDNWPIQGNTGYDFLCYVNNVFTQKSSEKSFTKFYQELVKEDQPIEKQLNEKKALILQQHMGGELSNLHRLFLELNLVEEDRLQALEDGSLEKAIGELLVQCPVYRYYGNQLPLKDEEANEIRAMLQRIRNSQPGLATAAGLLEDVLLIRPSKGDNEYNAKAIRFYQRSMQFTGPLMAKGVEDTLIYTYNRFIGHNEVGDSPAAFGDTPEEFHNKMLDRQQKWPLSLNGTSTHDTKRGEDVRARLNVLTDLPEEWFSAIKEWQQMNAGLKQNGAPDANDEYLIYQTLVGAYPNPGEDDDNFEGRIQEYLQKALREAKTHSDWAMPNEAYENAAKAFAVALLDQSKPFWKSFQKLQSSIADFGVINALAQVALKCTSSGVPDIYQGTELWDFSLVDPDNRRPVDYAIRQQLLDELETQAGEAYESFISGLWKSRYSGKIKLWLIHKLLQVRSQNKELFSFGDYIPLVTEGSYKNNVLAFARSHENTWIVVAVALHTAALCREQHQPVLSIDWQDTKIILPAHAPADFENLLSGEKGKQPLVIAVKETFTHLPIAVLKLQ